MLRVYSTKSRKTEEFRPLKKGEVGMYVCGPTVYGPGHIGHARTYVAFDFIRRYLEHKGFRVKYVVNITDVHDDMIEEANKQGITIFELADRNIKLFMKDIKELGIKEPTKMPRVTEHIEEIVSMVETLLKKGVAYETDDGVYFSVSKYPDYGKLSNIKAKASKTGTRVETDKYDKESPMDFALWKKARAGEPSWNAPFGRGRPGWHIECSAMSAKYLGKRFDIHGGAVDLVFPHHENEIAQSEACFGEKPFVKYWLHAGFLNVRGEKMSKSLGNFITIPGLLEKYNPKDFRFYIASLHYRSLVDFSDANIGLAKKNRERWNNFIQELLDANGKGNPRVERLVSKAKKGFEEEMDSDFNLPNAWAVLYEFLSEMNSLLAQKKVSKKDAQTVLAFLKEFDSVFGVFGFAKREVNVPAPIMQLVQKRELLRKKKDFPAADRIRARVREMGFELMDTPEGVKVKKKR